MDFLSVLKIDNQKIKSIVSNSDFLILNSLRLLNRSLPILQSHREINPFLDNDHPAREAKESLKEKGIQYQDASPIYSSHKDVNEYLMDSLKNKQGQDLPKRRSLRMRR